MGNGEDHRKEKMSPQGGGDRRPLTVTRHRGQPVQTEAGQRAQGNTSGIVN